MSEKKFIQKIVTKSMKTRKDPWPRGPSFVSKLAPWKSHKKQKRDVNENLWKLDWKNNRKCNNLSLCSTFHLFYIVCSDDEEYIYISIIILYYILSNCNQTKDNVPSKCQLRKRTKKGTSKSSTLTCDVHSLHPFHVHVSIRVGAT